MTCTRILNALLNQLRKIKCNMLLLARAFTAGFQYLLDSIHQAVAVLEHQAIELLALGLIELSAFQSLQMQANRGNRSLQFVGNRINEAVVLLVAANFAD